MVVALKRAAGGLAALCRGRIIVKTLGPVLILTLINFAAVLTGTTILLRGIESGYEEVIFGRIIPDLQHMSDAVLAGEQANLAKAERAAIEDLVNRLKAEPGARAERFPAESMRERIKERRVRGGIDKPGALFFVPDAEAGLIRVYRSHHDSAGSFREVEAVSLPSPTPEAGAEALSAEFNAATRQIDQQRGRLADLQLSLGRLQDIVGETVTRIETARDGIREGEIRTALTIGPVIAVIALTSLLLVLWLIYRQVHAIKGLGGAIEAMAAAHSDETRLRAIAIPATHLRDELGVLARGIDQARGAFIAIGRMEFERRADKEREAADRRRLLESLALDFDAEAGRALDAIARACLEFRDTAHAMAAQSETGLAQARAAAAAAELAADEVSTVSAAGDHLAASVEGVGDNVATSTQLVGAVRANAEDARIKVAGLSQSAERIGRVAQTINDIASQTNLLALNATIEAARAGDAGKGFAVVAGEVKALANQTAKATEEVSAQVAEVQGAIATVAAAITAIADEIGGLNHIAETIEASVADQRRAADRIAGGTGRAAEGTAHLNLEIGKVQTAAGAVSTAAGRVTETAEAMTHTAETVKSAFAAFVERLREAA